MNNSDQRRHPFIRYFTWLIFILVSYVAIMCVVYPKNLQEFRLYFTEDRPVISFQFKDLSQDWTERDLQDYFKNVIFNCTPSEVPSNSNDRNCFVDVRGFNSIPAMFVTFFFRNERLTRVSVNYPWWAQAKVYRNIEGLYGRPTSSQFWPVEGFRLHGWKLPDGAAVFINRDYPINIIQWNSILWQSPRACIKEGCFID